MAHDLEIVECLFIQHQISRFLSLECDLSPIIVRGARDEHAAIGHFREVIHRGSSVLSGRSP